MFLALAVFLLQPFPASIPSFSNLPIQSANYSLAIFSVTQQPDVVVEDLDAESASFSFLPGQTELTPTTSTGESSSRFDSDSVSNKSSSSRRSSPYRPPPAELAGRGVPKMWYILGAAEHGAATFDAWTTRRVITSGAGQEMNPMLRPFANSGAIYAAVQVGPILFDLLAKHMLHSSHRWERKIWWLPQSASAVTSFVAGARNLTIH